MNTPKVDPLLMADYDLTQYRLEMETDESRLATLSASITELSLEEVLAKQVEMMTAEDLSALAVQDPKVMDQLKSTPELKKMIDKTLANPGPKPGRKDTKGLNPFEATVLIGYTGLAYDRVNLSLEAAVIDKFTYLGYADLNAYYDRIGVYGLSSAVKVLASALNKLPGGGDAVVYHGFGRRLHQFNLHDDSVGDTFRFPRFVSTSTEQSVSERFLKDLRDPNPIFDSPTSQQPSGTLFKINVTDARSVEFLSKYPEEKELLLPPGAVFKWFQYFPIAL